MAEGGNYISQIACRYFRHGMCRKGDQCQYSHNFEPEFKNRYCEVQAEPLKCLTSASNGGFGHEALTDVGVLKPQPPSEFGEEGTAPAGDQSHETTDTGCTCSGSAGQELMNNLKFLQSPCVDEQWNETAAVEEILGTEQQQLDGFDNVTTSEMCLTYAQTHLSDSPNDSATGALALLSDPQSLSCFVDEAAGFENDDTVEFADGAAMSSEWKLLPDKWVEASEFVPGQLWQSLDGCLAGNEMYSGYAMGGTYGDCESMPLQEGCENFEFAAASEYMELCDMCGQQLPPKCEEQLRQKHIQECIRLHEEEMELSFAVQQSMEKVCGICMEVVWEKEPEKEARFGILSSCSHVFCLSCIRRWRAAQQFDKKTVKSCPECRVTSNFVVPSRYWADSSESKAKLIASYQAELGKKHCKYFKRGKGECPFNDKCFYLHAYPDGRIASPRPTRRRTPGNASRQRDRRVQLMETRENDDVASETDSDDENDDDDSGVSAEPTSLYEIIEQLNERVARLANQLENSFLYRWMNATPGIASDDADID